MHSSSTRDYEYHKSLGKIEVFSLARQLKIDAKLTGKNNGERSLERQSVYLSNLPVTVLDYVMVPTRGVEPPTY